MRRVITQLSKCCSKEHDHLGLAYGSWAPADRGKVPDEKRAEWLNDLAKRRVPEDYRHAFTRWESSFRSPDSLVHRVALRSRLLVGHGNPSSTEVGLTVHHTWGVPLIPGSALKGLSAHFLETNYGPDEVERHPMDATHPESERAAYSGPLFSKAILRHGPGKIYRVLFGAPPCRSDQDFETEGAGETAGCVTFHDAIYVPGSTSNDAPYAVDVLTVHQKDYYRTATSWPNDYDDPNPASFLTVRPGAELLVALSGPRAWTAFAMQVLLEALTDWGIGGKTSAGYGRIKATHWKPQRSIPPMLEAFQRWMDGPAKGMQPRDQIATIEKEWLEPLRSLPARDRETARRLIQEAISENKRTKDALASIAHQLK